MNNFKPYCPKCGTPLGPGRYDWCLYECTNPDCRYTLNEKNTIDIGYKGKGISKALSNLCPYPFVIDGIFCSSMESFIQSLKVQDPDVQEDICSKSSVFCYSIREMHDDWRVTQTVYWRGKAIDRHSDEYVKLMERAYKNLYEQSATFRYALEKSNGYKLIHSIGCLDNTQTLLTENEYISLLNSLRKDNNL